MRRKLLIGLLVGVVVAGVVVLAVLKTIPGGARDSAKPEKVLKSPLKVYETWPFSQDEARARQVDTSKALDIDTATCIDLGNGTSMKLMLIPAGRFKTDGQFVVIKKPFYIGATEVTRQQLLAVLGSVPSGPGVSRSTARSQTGDRVVDGDYPAGWCDEEHAVEFCKRLSARNKGIFRLPSETEWEYACRAGNAGRFHFGDDERQLDEYGWYSPNSGRHPHPVGAKQPNAWGLYDMHGNVEEYCTVHPRMPMPTTGNRGYIMKGGNAFSLRASGLASSNRDGADHIGPEVGFRVLLEIEITEEQKVDEPAPWPVDVESVYGSYEIIGNDDYKEDVSDPSEILDRFPVATTIRDETSAGAWVVINRDIKKLFLAFESESAGGIRAFWEFSLVGIRQSGRDKYEFMLKREGLELRAYMEKARTGWWFYAKEGNTYTAFCQLRKIKVDKTPDEFRGFKPVGKE